MTDFPPLQYSSAFIPWLIQVASEQNVDISSTLKCEREKSHLWTNGKKITASWLNKTKEGKRLHDVLQSLALSSLAPATSPLFLLNHRCQQPQTPTSTNGVNETAIRPPDLVNQQARNFIQLSGHPGVLAPAGPNSLWKRLGDGSHEKEVYTYLKNSNDKMCDIIPKYFSETNWQNEIFIELEDLFTKGFKGSLGIMDIKMGSRTFLESEVSNSKERADLYEKMIKIDPSAPTEEEHSKKSITKLRYMQFREEQSSTSMFSFRIEAVKFQDKDEPSKLSSLKVLKDRPSIADILDQFISSNPTIKLQLLERLKYIRSTLEESTFFQTYEVIGSSILLIRDEEKCGAWMIDFAKTVKCDHSVNHRRPWEIGNHEDGYLNGLDHLINIIESF